MRNPLVSVVIPARNEEEHITAALEAILAQTYKKLEAIVVNDGSTDRTAAIVNKHAGRDKRINLFNFKQGHSAAFARNYGAGRARGEILVFFDADCTARENYLKNIVRQLTENKLDGVSNKTLAAPAKTFIGKCVAALSLIHI